MNDIRVRVFIEGKPYAPSDVENCREVIQAIKRKRIFNEAESKFAMCGFLVVNDTPVVIFPKNYPIDDGEKILSKKTIDEARRLFLTFGLYRSRMSATSGWLHRLAYGMNEDEAEAITGIEEILYVLNDYRQNGYLVRRRKVISQTKPGRIAWSKTLHKTVPIVNHGQVAYTSPYMKSNVRHDEEMVQRIHRYLVYKFSHQWGWLVDDIESEGTKLEPPCTPDEAIKYLSDELTVCFVQREIELLRCMRRYYMKMRGKNLENKAEYMLTPEFEQIWQNVCGYVMDNVYASYKDNVPKAIFEPSQDMIQKDNVRYSAQTWSQEPDILCKRDDGFYILDAKYYTDYRNLPKEDIIKQFVYAYTIGSSEGIYVRGNALLLPGHYTSEESFTYLGDATVPHVDGFGKIQFWEMNVRKMLDAYNTGICGCMAGEFFSKVEEKS